MTRTPTDREIGHELDTAEGIVNGLLLSVAVWIALGVIAWQLWR